jgi:hypothetical protein
MYGDIMAVQWKLLRINIPVVFYVVCLVLDESAT